MKDSYYVISDMYDTSELLVRMSGGKIETFNTVVKYDIGFEGFSFYKRSYLTSFSDASSALKDVEESNSSMLTFVDEDVSEEFVKGLKKMGFAKMVQQTAMICDLSDLKEEDFPQVKIISKDEGEKWVSCCMESFGKPDDPAFDYFVKNDDVILFGYFEEGKIVGTLMLYTKGDNAGIHEVGVLKEHRRKGIASALVKTALKTGKQQGASFATLQASPDGELAYASIGFKKTGSVSSFVRVS